MSEASAKTIERAHAVHPIAALQTDYSISSRDIEKDIIPNLQTNLGALDCRLTEEDRATLNELADQVLGDRYSPEGMAAIDQ
ncbi:MAG: hypothetical protein QNJ58_21610 [Desulfobacterales bacterium]|nr:hypothetical protein [Desulfobacterales bacterium]